LGGIVTHVAVVDRGYRVIVSELPFDPSGRHRPAVDQWPRGHFILLIPNQVLPRDLRPGAEVTVVGEILGTGSVSGSAVDDMAPVLEERHVKIWGPSWWPHFQIGVWGGIGI
jgi:starvation-inducible outer membrane lipoprotein